MEEADRAGGVLEDELLRRAEELDDKFARLWRNWATNSKAAILNTASALDDLGNWWVRAGENLRLALPEGLRENSARATLADRMGGGLLAAQFNEGLFYRTDLNLPTSSRRGDRQTILPKRANDNGKPTKQSTQARAQQISQYERILGQLAEEQRLIGLSATEQRKMIPMRRAGVTAASDQGKVISLLVDQIDRQTAAQHRSNDMLSLIGGIADSEIGRFVAQLGFADTAAGRLAATLAEAALKASLLGEGPLASALGGGGGLLPMLFDGISSGIRNRGINRAFAGMYSNGGYIGAGKWGIAGEDGRPEPVIGPAQVISNRDAFQSGDQINVSMTIQTPDVESFKRSETQVMARLVDSIERGRRAR